MKRGAEKQITKDDFDNEGDDAEEKATGFAKANEAELATRKIKALPKRSMLGTPSPTPPTSAPPSVNSSPEQPSKPKFAHFSGFGSTANSSPFTFTASVPSSGSDSFSKLPSLNPPALSSPFTHNPYSNLKSIFGNSSTDDLEKPRSISKEDADYKVDIEFYKSMRGLNISFTRFLLKALEDDPFNDLSQVFEQYQTKQRTIQSVWDNHFKGHSDDHKRDDGSSSIPAAPTMPQAITKSLSPPVAMPTPPSSFGGSFKQSTSTSASQVTESPKAGFTSMPEAPKASSSGFTFSFPSGLSTSSLPTGPPAPTFALGTSAAGSTLDSQPETKSTFTFGSLAPESAKSTPFGSSSQPLFGNSSPATTSLFGNSLTPKPKDSSTTSTSLFGNPDNSNPFLGFGRSSSSSSGDKPTTPPGTFGAFAGKSFTGFGTASPPSGSGSIGNPVGFGFGSPPKMFSVPESSSSTGFIFPREPPPLLASTSADISSGTKEGESEDEDHSKILSPTSFHDQEGEGEESEETTHSVKSKVYKLNKGEGVTGWTDLGIGILRVKKHKGTSSRRLLLRNSSTGKLVINFSIHSGMKPSTSKQTVSFMGHDDQGVAIPFRLRVKTESAAQELKDVLDREIEFVKGKSD